VTFPVARCARPVGGSLQLDVLGDPLSITIPDPDHAAVEEREFPSSARALRHSMKDATMKKRRSTAPDRYRLGVNVILLEPEPAAAFPDSKSVNDALRALLEIADRTAHRKRA
jgi:hypothetical protein